MGFGVVRRTGMLFAHIVEARDGRGLLVGTGVLLAVSLLATVLLLHGL